MEDQSEGYKYGELCYATQEDMKNENNIDEIITLKNNLINVYDRRIKELKEIKNNSKMIE